MRRSLPQAFLTASLLAPAFAVGSEFAGAQSPVVIVDEALGPGADFDELHAAVDQALDGSILLVRPGSYETSQGIFGGTLVNPSGKSLAIIAEQPDTVELAGLETRIGPAALDDRIAMRGIRMSGDLDVLDALGQVWLEEIVYAGDVDLGLRPAVLSSRSVSVQRCDFRGPNGILFGGASGCVVVDSDFYSYDTLYRGGGNQAPGGPPGEFFADVSIGEASQVFLSASAKEPLDVDVAATADIQLVEVSLGPDDALPNVSSLAAVSRGFEASAVVREGQPVDFAFRGIPGELAILNVSTGVATETLPFLAGAGVIGLPLGLIQIVGVVPASGELTASLGTPSNLVDPGMGAVFFSQASFANTSIPFIQVGAGSMTAIVDASTP